MKTTTHEQAKALLAHMEMTNSDFVPWGDGEIISKDALKKAVEEFQKTHADTVIEIASPSQSEQLSISAKFNIMQDDIAEMLRALGIGDHARSMSPHRVVQDEVLPGIRRLVGDASLIESLRDALRPFAKVYNKRMPDNAVIYSSMHSTITVADFKHAKELLDEHNLP